MFGPKLEPRSYTTLLLVVIAVLLSLNLFAQKGDESRSDASAIADVARATSEVAAANREIATALREVSQSLGKIRLEAPAAAAPAMAAPSAPAVSEAGEAGTEEEYQGTFTAN